MATDEGKKLLLVPFMPEDSRTSVLQLSNMESKSTAQDSVLSGGSQVNP